MVGHSNAGAVVSVVPARVDRHVDKQSSEEGRSEVAAHCLDSFIAQTHKLLGQGSQRERDSTLHFTKHPTHKVTRVWHQRTATRPPSTRGTTQSSRSRLLSRTANAAFTWPAGPLLDPSFCPLITVTTLPRHSIIGNHDYNTTACTLLPALVPASDRLCCLILLLSLAVEAFPFAGRSRE